MLLLCVHNINEISLKVFQLSLQGPTDLVEGLNQSAPQGQYLLLF